MRLKSVYISQYKNLKDFTLNFDSGSFIDIFVGKNGTGKSNLFEALIEIFHHLYEYDKDGTELDFDYSIKYKINEEEIETTWDSGSGKLKVSGTYLPKLNDIPLPDNVLIYYSGHNSTVTDLVERYKAAFRKRIRRAEVGESRRFIGIGSEYKELLLAILLMQKKNNKAQKFICQKLGIKTISSEVKLILKRPFYADSRFDIEFNDESDRYWKPEGITKTFLDKLSTCISKATNGLERAEGYFSSDDRYILYFDISKIQTEFNDFKSQDFFQQLDNLKTLGMLEEISIELILENDIKATINHFSDGQFQSVYIYSIVEIFKNKNCITLLDEPDSFLHPEWQFGFLKQVFEITDAVTTNNHILMSSHSASTITMANKSLINLFEVNESNIVVTKVNKGDVIKSLSAGLILFSESEARLSIHHALSNTTGAVLFTEGITDSIILETAWSKLYPNEIRTFEIQSAYGSSFLRNLMKDNALYQNHPGRTFFALFDFDEAYNEWKQLGQDVQTNPDLCLVRKHAQHESYALLLPVPTTSEIRKQVINPRSGSNYKSRSLLTIELLFYGVNGLEQYFVVDAERTDGFIKFVSESQKSTFAKDKVPALSAEHFTVFCPIFDFIRSKCPAPAVVGART